MVDLSELGFSASESVPVYDIWGKESLGTVKGSLSTKVPSHGARLFRLGDAIANGIDRTQAYGETTGNRQYKDASFDLSGRMAPSSHQKHIVVKNGKKVIQR